MTSGGWVLAATIAGSSMAFIDMSVVNVALPRLQEALTASGPALQWVVNAYSLTLGALILVGGAAGDRYGRRRIFLTGMAIFAIASMLCGLAPDARFLIAARALQGIGGALMVPQSLALISASFAPETRGRAIGTWAGVAALTTALGPPLGGFLVSLSWRAIFFVNVPIAAGSFLLTLWHVPESRDPDAAPLDWIGAVLVTLGLAGITAGAIAAAPPGGTAGPVAAWTLAGIAVLAAFVWHERRATHPMLPGALFHDRAFVGANVATLLLYAALSFSLFLLPFALIRVRGLSPTAAGASFLPLSLLMGLLSRFAGGAMRVVGARPMLVAGPIVVAIGFVLLARASDPSVSYWWAVPPGMIAIGLGMTAVISPLTTTALQAAPDRLSGTASGVNNAVSRIAGLLAVAVLGTVVLHDQAARLGPGVPAAGFADASGDGERGPAARSAFQGAARDASWICAALALAAAGVAGVTLGGARNAVRQRLQTAAPATHPHPRP